MSGKWRQKGVSIIGCVNPLNNRYRSAVIINEHIKRKLNKEFGMKNIEHELYSACINILLNPIIDEYDKIIICNDYNYKKVAYGLGMVFNQTQILKFISLNEFRTEINNPNKKSEADNYLIKVRKHYKKNKNIHRKHKILETTRIIGIEDIKIVLNKILNK